MGAFPNCHMLVVLVMIFMCNVGPATCCLESERQALLMFKGGLIDESNRLGSWVDVDGGNCCDWYGVSCNNSTGHVIGLHLQVDIDEYDPKIYLSYDDYERTEFRGTISRSLLHLNQLVHLNLSWNNFVGALIPSFLGLMTSLQQLDLSSAGFGGKIPSQIGNLTNLDYLGLGGNLLSSDSLQWVSSLSLLHHLDLSRVDLSKARDWLYSINTIPFLSELILSYCQLDHQLQGEIPSWIGKSNLTILDLRSNGFHGKLPPEICALAALQIIDLANNNLSGPIPRCINKLREMTTNESMGSQISKPAASLQVGGYVEDAILVIKGRVMEYNTTLNLVRIVDFSNNFFTGKIPDEVAALAALQSLNLSQNTLSGEIPQNIGAMRLLESLDLSFNRLNGEIPSSISSLNFLNHLNLSSNNLTGRIPSSTQLQSFNASCFAGNELCGSPLAKGCDENEATPPAADTHNGTLATIVDDEWFFVSMAFGFVIGFWGFLFHLLCNRQWRITFFSFLDKSGIFIRELVNGYM